MYQVASLPTWSETTGAMDGILRLPNTQASEPKEEKAAELSEVASHLKALKDGKEIMQGIRCMI